MRSEVADSEASRASRLMTLRREPLISRQDPEGLRQRVDVRRVRVGRGRLTDHLVRGVVGRSYRLPFDSEPRRVRERNESEIPDQPVPVEFIQVPRLDVAVRDP